MIDRACEGISDPAEVFAVSFRISGRLAGRTLTWQFITGLAWTY